MKKKISWIIAVLWFSGSFAQDFSYESKVEAVQEKGFHKITLSPELLGKTTSGHADLRIYNEQNKEEPFILSQEESVSITSLFKEYEIIEKEYKKDAISHLIFHNPDKESIDNVSFIVKNTDVQKRARLSGSDDNEHWYVIKNNYLLHSMYSTDETTELKILNFPLSDYKFFKLEINDNWRLPINILKVGYYDTQKVKGKSTLFDITSFEQNDSLKTSFIKVSLPDSMYLERMKFTVSGADYYSRHTRILIRKEKITRKKKVISYFQPIGSFYLNSNSTNEIDLGGRTLNEFYVEIENRDNQPLVLEQIEGMYLNKYVIIDLQPKQVYMLKFGDENLRSPDYDIVSFADQIPEDVKKIKHGKIVKLFATDVIVKPQSSIFDNPYIIWSVIGLVGLILSFVSMKMIKEIGQKA